jgi:hypothetical protein
MRLLAAGQPAHLSRAECAYTRGAAEDVFYYIEEPASRFDGEKEKLHKIEDASLRSLLIFGICPSVGEEVLAHHAALKSSWTTMIDDALKGPEAVYFEQGVTAIACLKSTPLLCGIKRKLEASFQDTKATGRNPKGQEISFPQRIMSDAADEYSTATGEILAATDNLAFVLLVYPEQFYAYMESHQDVLESWLSQASATLFRGEPASRDDLAEYKSHLVARVERYVLLEPRLDSTRNKVLTMLKSAPVSAID